VGELLRHDFVARAFGAAGRRWVEGHFSFDGQARAYERLLAEVVRPRAPEATAACAS